jgi:hypothetical protein
LARRAALLALGLALLAAGCGGGGDGGSTVPCDDKAFRAQDEELYVTHATVSNAISSSGDPAALLLDLRRARKALAGYLDAHPPCDEALAGIATTEQSAISALDEAISARAAGEDGGEPLARAKAALEKAQKELAGQ